MVCAGHWCEWGLSLALVCYAYLPSCSEGALPRLGSLSPLFTSRPFYMPGTGLSPEGLLRGTNHAVLAHSLTSPVPLNHSSPGRWDRPELYSSLSQKYGQPIFACFLSLLPDSLSFPLLAQARNLVLPPLPAVCSQPPRLSVPRLAAGAGRLRFLYSV